GHEVLDRGGTGEGDPVGLVGENFGGAGGSVVGHHGAVGLDHIHLRAAASEFDRNQVARHGGARQQDSLSAQVVIRESGDQSLGDILGAHQVHFQMQSFDSGAGGGADGADACAQRAPIKRGTIEPLDEASHAGG